MTTARGYLLMTGALVALAGCASQPTGEPPSLTYGYVEGRQVEPPADEPAMPSVPVPLAGIATTLPKPEPVYRSASAKTAAMVRKSRRDAIDCSFEGSIMTCPYQNGLRTQVIMDGPSKEFGDDGEVTLFFLEGGEGTPEAIFGNPNYFHAEVTGGGVAKESMRAKRDRASGQSTARTRLIIAVKAYNPGESTTLSIATGDRIYLYDLRAPSCPANQQGRKCNLPYHPVVQHTYDSDQPALRAPKPSTPRAAGGEVADTRYAFTGPEEFLPREWSAYNDGVKTYVLPPPRLASRPVPFFPEGMPSPNFWLDPVSKNYVIRGLPTQIMFKRGEQVMTVRKE